MNTEDDDIICVRELLEHCEDTDDSCDVFVKINDLPIGFGVVELDYDFDGSVKLIIKDENLHYKE